MKRPHSSVFRFAALLLALSATALIGSSTWAKASTIATESNTSHSENNTIALPATAQNSASAGSAIPQEPASNDTLLRVQVGDQVPSFTVEMFDGSQVCIDSLRGKVVWINFWATWCPPCRAELKQVQQRIIDRFKGEEFVFLPISRGETQETVAAFREAQGYTFPMGLDPNKEIYSLFASMTIPRNFIIDQEGKIVVCEVGYTPGKLTDMIGQVENLLK